jgi:myo-inositol-1(or 4)-monophosphatase
MLKPLDVQSKGAAGPVTNIDRAVDALLTELLRGARPDYGWLSEETPDVPDARQGKARVFMLDPIDGTAAMIARVPEFTISIGIVENGRPFAGVVYNPLTDDLFLGAPGHGARRNGAPMRVSGRASLEGARMIGMKSRFTDKKWPQPWPKLEIIQKQSIAYRLALVACGDADATILFGFKHEWDIAAGAALIEAAGGRVSDPWGGALSFNQPIPRAPGVAAAGVRLHALLVERLVSLPDPRQAGVGPG